MFAMGTSFGAMRMALVACGIPFIEVAPRKWQSELGIAARAGEDYAEHKRRLKDKAQSLYPCAGPDCPITLATCDALLLAHYCLTRRF